MAEPDAKRPETARSPLAELLGRLVPVQRVVTIQPVFSAAAPLSTLDASAVERLAFAPSARLILVRTKAGDEFVVPLENVRSFNLPPEPKK